MIYSSVPSQKKKRKKKMEEKYCRTVSQTAQKAYLGIVCKQKAQTYGNRHGNGTIKTEKC